LLDELDGFTGVAVEGVPVDDGIGAVGDGLQLARGADAAAAVDKLTAVAGDAGGQCGGRETGSAEAGGDRGAYQFEGESGAMLNRVLEQADSLASALIVVHI